jgi:hypothetical protein
MNMDELLELASRLPSHTRTHAETEDHVWFED